MTNRLRFLVLVVCCTCWTVIAHGQNSETPPAGTPVTLQQKVEPSYRIEPVVQRSKARRGEVVPFSFLMTSTGKELNVELQPVQLRQEESGIVMHDSNSAPSEQVKFSSPQKFFLAAGKEQVITGEVTIPKTKTNFYSFGILVRDQGQFPDFGKNDGAQPKVKAGVRFVTQYVIRIDVDVDGTTDHDVEKLKFESGEIRSLQGQPVAVVYLQNPTENTLEFQIRGQLQHALSEAATRRDQFAFHMPCRATIEGPEQKIVRVLPGTRLRLEAPITGDLLPGENQLKVGLHQGLRDQAQHEFPVTIKAGQFPKLEAGLVRLDDQLSLTPGNVMMGTYKGGKRSVVIKLANNSDQPRSVKLSPTTLTGEALSSVQLSNDTVTIPPKQTETVRALLRFDAGNKQNQFGYIAISSQDVTSVTGQVPVALLTQLPTEELVQLGEFHLNQLADEQFEITLPIKNISAGFVPLAANLEILNEQGDRLELTAGFGRWSEPGTDTKLTFGTKAVFLPGKYQLKFQLLTYPGLPPIVRTQEWNLEAAK
jgi:hypothetical protein